MKEKIYKILEQFTSTHYGSSVVNDVHTWLTSPDHKEEKTEALRRLWDGTREAEDNNTQNALDEVYSKITSIVNVPEPELPKNRRKFLVASLLTTAAAVALIAGTFLFTRSHYTPPPLVEYQAHSDSITDIILPDGSRVKLNTESILLYPEEFKGDTRVVHLIGEGYFTVVADEKHPFIVRTNDLNIKAVGTEFNISAYPETVYIAATLIKGTVLATSGTNEESYTLVPGNQVIYNKLDGASSVSDVDVEEVTSWLEGFMLFRDATVHEIFASLEKKFDVTFNYNSSRFNDDKYHVKFKAGASMEQMLHVLGYVVGGFRYEEIGDRQYTIIR